MKPAREAAQNARQQPAAASKGATSCSAESGTDSRARAPVPYVSGSATPFTEYTIPAATAYITASEYATGGTPPAARA